MLLLPPPDYSQVELRLLAHFSGDRLLQQLLSQSGPGGDVFSLIAAAWLQQGAAGPSGAAAAHKRQHYSCTVALLAQQGKLVAAMCASRCGALKTATRCTSHGIRAQDL